MLPHPSHVRWMAAILHHLKCRNLVNSTYQRRFPSANSSTSHPQPITQTTWVEKCCIGRLALVDIIDYGFVVRICGSPKWELAQLVAGSPGSLGAGERAKNWGVCSRFAWLGAIRHFGWALRDCLHERKFWKDNQCIHRTMNTSKLLHV